MFLQKSHNWYRLIIPVIYLCIPFLDRSFPGEYTYTSPAFGFTGGRLETVSSDGFVSSSTTVDIATGQADTLATTLIVFAWSWPR